MKKEHKDIRTHVTLPQYKVNVFDDVYLYIIIHNNCIYLAFANIIGMNKRFLNVAQSYVGGYANYIQTW